MVKSLAIEIYIFKVGVKFGLVSTRCVLFHKVPTSF